MMRDRYKVFGKSSWKDEGLDIASICPSVYDDNELVSMAIMEINVHTQLGQSLSCIPIFQLRYFQKNLSFIDKFLGDNVWGLVSRFPLKCREGELTYRSIETDLVFNKSRMRLTGDIDPVINKDYKDGGNIDNPVNDIILTLEATYSAI